MRTNVNSLTPGELIYPGEYLLDELEAKGISQKDFALQIGMQPTQLNEIIKGKGKRAINAETALLLEKALGISAEYWLNIQKNYELDAAKINKKTQLRLEAIEIWHMIKDNVSWAFYKKQNIISGDPLNDIPIIKEVYNIANFEQLAQINANQNYARFKRSDVLQVDKTNLIGWVKLVEYNANQYNVKPFDLNKKKSLIDELKIVFIKNKDVKAKVKEILNSYGIKIVYQEKGEKTPIDGISFWSEGNPAIGMSLRHNRIDNFAFTLFHELGHIFLHLPNNNKIEFIDLFDIKDDYSKNPEETEANTFAEDMLISRSNWDEFFNDGKYSDIEIKKFAKQMDTHPAIVKGRICRTTGIYNTRTKIKYDIN